MVKPTNVNYKDHFKKKSPQRADHLKENWWKPGQSGNLTGRPRGAISLVETLKKYLRRNPEALEEIVLALVKEGRLGNMVATKEMLDRIDGKVAERHKIEGELPVTIQFVPAQELLGKEEGQIVKGEFEEIEEDLPTPPENQEI